MKTLTALKAKQARSSHAHRSDGASIRFTEDHVAFTTYCDPCFIDSKEIPGDLNGIISINMPKVFTDVMAGEIGIISRINFTEGENKGKSIVSINFFRSENVVKGGLLSKIYYSRKTFYLTQDGIRRIREAKLKKKSFKWLLV